MYHWGMGMFRIPLRISHPTGGPEREVMVMPDTGSFYTHLPASLLREIGLTPTETEQFELADGSVVERGITEARAAIDGRSVTTIVAFSEDDVEPLLGAYTLEGLRLTVDPVNETLRAAPAPRR